MSESKKGRYIGAGVVLVILIVFFLHMQGFLGHRVEPGRIDLKPVDVGNLPTSTVEAKILEDFETAVGTVTSRKETMISSKIPAHIKIFHVRPGQSVSRDDLLIELDDRDLKAKLGQARSGLSAAKAARTQAESAFKRYQNLIKTGAATQAEFEGVEAQYEVAGAKVNEAQKAIEELDVMMGYTTIKAPYSGVIVEKMASEGTLAAPGVPLLKLEDPEQLRLEIYVPESRRGTIEIGKTLMVEFDALKKEVPGVVDEIVPSADPRSRSFLVRLSLQEDASIHSGLFGRCYLPTENRPMLLVDHRAVYRVGQLAMVKVIVEDDLETRLVRIGAKHDTKVEILSGLKAGETVVLQALQEG